MITHFTAPRWGFCWAATVVGWEAPGPSDVLACPVLASLTQASVFTACSKLLATSESFGMGCMMDTSISCFEWHMDPLWHLTGRNKIWSAENGNTLRSNSNLQCLLNKYTDLGIWRNFGFLSFTWKERSYHAFIFPAPLCLSYLLCGDTGKALICWCICIYSYKLYLGFSNICTKGGCTLLIVKGILLHWNRVVSHES